MSDKEILVKAVEQYVKNLASSLFGFNSIPTQAVINYVIKNLNDKYGYLIDLFADKNGNINMNMLGEAVREEIFPMPSDKKRINLTVTDELYARIQEYKKEHGVSGDASACLQLIVQQLNNLANSKVMLQLLRNCSVEQLTAISQEGFTELKNAVEKQEK